MKIADNQEVYKALSESLLYRNYQRAFREVTGLPLSIQAVGAWNLAHCGQRNENSLCAWMGKKSATCACCLRVQDTACKHAAHEPFSMTCPQGLSETAVPIRAGSQTVAFLRTGQVLHRKPSPQQWNRVSRRLQPLVGISNLEEAREAYAQSRVMSLARYQSSIELLHCFAEQLSIVSNQILIQRETLESPFIKRAKDYLQAHYSEKLSLGEVAKALNMSKFYFCKLFKKATGLHFTHYLSRLRLDKAKTLLLNPHLRISEIAFEIGFQSLTHFNRVFKELTGESPTDFRARSKKGLLMESS
jgi:AraC-like DNA-binding protein